MALRSVLACGGDGEAESLFQGFQVAVSLPRIVKDDNKSFTGGTRTRGELSELFVYQDRQFFFRQ